MINDNSGFYGCCLVIFVFLYVWNRDKCYMGRCGYRIGLILVLVGGFFFVGGAKEVQRVDVDRLFDEAWEHVRIYEFSRAEPIFRRIISQTKTGTEKWIEASFGLALSLHHKTPPDKSYIEEAKRIYLSLAKKYPSHRCAPRCLMEVGRIYELRDYYKDKIDLKKAREYYRMVIDKYPSDPIVSEAVLRLAQAYTISFNREEIRKGIRVIKDWLKKHPDDRLRGVMYLHLGDVYFYPLGEYRKCIDAYVKADELGALEEGREGFIYWRVAWLADHKVGDRKIAVKYYKKLIVDVPTFGKGYRAQLALKRLGVKDIPELKWSPKPKKIRK